MNKYRYDGKRKASSSPELLSASAEELRVLIALFESEKPLSEEEIAACAKVSPARARGAVALWCAEGVVASECETLTEEFEPRVRKGEIIETPAAAVAESIRDESLAELIEECAEILGKPALTTEEVKNLTALVTQYALTPDYVATLAAYMSSKHRITVVRLRDRAISLANRGIDTTEALEVYLKDREKESSSELEFRRLLGIYNRTVTEAERRAFNKWSDEFGYSTAVVSEAYSICVMNTGALSVPYMDKILTTWHGAGCKTVEECRALAASEKAKAEKDKQPAQPPRKRGKSEPEKPRYGDFDINDAFKAALERSYE